MPRISLDDLRTIDHAMTPEQRARLEALTEDEIERLAESDEDSPPMTDAQLDRAVAARDVRLIREATGLTQAAFAERYAIVPSRLRDWEQGRFKPDSVAMAYLRLIRHDPKLVARVVAQGAPAKSVAPRGSHKTARKTAAGVKAARGA